jgi:hypothetical protein
VYMDASRKKTENTYKISLHIIINNVFIKNRLILKNLIKEFKTTLLNDILYHDAIDTSIYNQPQLFKCVLSPSKDDNTLLKPFKIENDNIIFYNNDYIMDNIYDFLVGLYKYEENFIDNNLNYIIIKNEINKNTEKSKNSNTKNIDNSLNKTIISKNKKKWILNNEYIKNIYGIRNDYTVNNRLDLIRINSAYCKVCGRVHDNENAYCMVTDNSIFFHCGRNPSKGVGIGFWYNNFNNKNNNTTNIRNINKGINTDINSSYNNLNNIISEMKEYIYNLENKYNIIKEEFNLLSAVHKKCNNHKNEKNNINCKNNNSKNNSNIKSINRKYTKDITSEMWQKYYRLGKYISQGLCDLVEKIRCHWKDGSFGRLKKRGLLIYEYINYINSNNIVNTISMRKIFHKKDYENFSSLL